MGLWQEVTLVALIEIVSLIAAVVFIVLTSRLCALFSVLTAFMCLLAVVGKGRISFISGTEEVLFGRRVGRIGIV